MAKGYKSPSRVSKNTQKAQRKAAGKVRAKVVKNTAKNAKAASRKVSGRAMKK